MHGWQSLTDDYMPIGMSVTSTGVCCVFLTVTVSTPLSKRAVMPADVGVVWQLQAAAHEGEHWV